jgi:hypothetical protein
LFLNEYLEWWLIALQGNKISGSNHDLNICWPSSGNRNKSLDNHQQYATPRSLHVFSISPHISILPLYDV